FVVNNLPVASDDAATTRREVPVTIAVLANDSDPDGGPLRVVSVTAPASGTATVEGGAMVTYAPNPGFAGIDSFSYLIVDDFGSEASAEVVVTVEDVPPIVIGDDQAMTRTGVPVVIDVLANDSGEGLFLGSAGAPSNGTTSIVDGAIRYAPAAGFVGTDSFTYEVGDANGQEGSGTVTVTVTPPPITATDDMAQTLRNRDVVIDVLRNDEGEMLELAAVEMPANGTATIEDGRVRFEPRRDFTGTDSFRYTVTDAGGESAQATVTVVVMPFNTTPVANDDAAVTDKNVAVVIDVLANDSDEDGDTLTIVSVDPQQTGFGTVAITADQQIRYTPNPGWWGGDSFTYTIDDGFGGQATASVVLDVRE
ncbi:MAG: Ig-like domain-containing protein, partial [Pseudomonadota bacterium]